MSKAQEAPSQPIQPTAKAITVTAYAAASGAYFCATPQGLVALDSLLGQLLAVRGQFTPLGIAHDPAANALVTSVFLFAPNPNAVAVLDSYFLAPAE